MRKTIWYIVGGQLAAISIPALAQDTAVDAAQPSTGQSAGPVMTPEQMAIVDSWPAEKQATFRQWPEEVRAYFWELPAERQDVFWRLNDSDKLAIATMDQAGRTAAWARIEAMSGDHNARAPAGEAGEAEEEAPEAPEPMGRS
ncbi:MAG: hypothetical protein R3E14_12755 [Erythrobacter sp.]